MDWKGSVREEKRQTASSYASSPTISTSPMAHPDTWSFELRDSASAGPACLSFVADAFSSSSSAYPAPQLNSSPQDCATGVSCNYSCSCALPPPMQSLLPSPFSCSSLSSFFPAHVPAHHCCTTAVSSPPLFPFSFLVASSSVPASNAPQFPRWRRRRSKVGMSWPENTLRLSSLASLASSLLSFSSAEKAFVGGAKEDLKRSRGGNTEQDDCGDAQHLARNLIGGNVRQITKGVANFFHQLPPEFRAIRRQNFGRAAKRKGSPEDLEEMTAGSASADGNEKRAKKIREGRKKAIQTSQHLMAGAIAAMVSRTVVAPLERLKLEYLVRGAKGSVIETLRNILMGEGVRGFWKGNGVNLLRTAPFKSVNFFAYDTYRRQLLKWGDRSEVTNFERLAAGAAAGITATVLCFPLDTIRTLMVAPGGEALGGMIGCFQHLIQTEGFLALYKGLLPAVVSMAPSGAVFYGVYDMLKCAYLTSPEGKAMLEARRRRALEKPEEINNQLELGPFRTLLFGALAGACSETVTYPFEVVRRAQQMQFAANKLGMVGTIQFLLKKGGVRAFYAGLFPSTLQVLPSAALSYFVYETVKIAFKIP